MEVEGRLEELREAGIGGMAIGFSGQEGLAAMRAELGLRILRRSMRAFVRGEGIPWSREDLRKLGAGALLREREVLQIWVTDESERRPSVEDVPAVAGG